MTKVYCDMSTCEYCKKAGADDFVCGRDEIEIFDECCYSYNPHVDMSPEYSETFWKRLNSRDDKHECKLEVTRGKRYELISLVWFTDQDDRWGTDEIWFTEQRSGLRCQGKDINLKNAGLIKDKVNSIPSVDTLPEALPKDI